MHYTYLDSGQGTGKPCSLGLEENFTIGNVPKCNDQCLPNGLLLVVGHREGAEAISVHYPRHRLLDQSANGLGLLATAGGKVLEGGNEGLVIAAIPAQLEARLADPDEGGGVVADAAPLLKGGQEGQGLAEVVVRRSDEGLGLGNFGIAFSRQVDPLFELAARRGS